MQWDAVFCGVLHCVAIHSSRVYRHIGHCSFVAVRCNVLQCAAVCCSVMQSVMVCCSVLQCIAVCCSVLLCDAEHYSVLQCVLQCFSIMMLPYLPTPFCSSVLIVCCTALQCVTVCYSALQCVSHWVCCHICPCPFLLRMRRLCNTLQHTATH